MWPAAHGSVLFAHVGSGMKCPRTESEGLRSKHSNVYRERTNRSADDFTGRNDRMSFLVIFFFPRTLIAFFLPLVALSIFPNQILQYMN